MSELRVKDIMDSMDDMFVVAPGAHLGEIMKNFGETPETSDVNDIVVVMDNDKIVGTLSRYDILKAIQPLHHKVNSFYDITHEVFWEGLFTGRCKQVTEELVEDYMRPPVMLYPDDNLMKASYVLKKNNANAALVAEKDRMVGIVSFNRLIQVAMDRS